MGDFDEGEDVVVGGVGDPVVGAEEVGLAVVLTFSYVKYVGAYVPPDSDDSIPLELATTKPPTPPPTAPAISNKANK